MGIFIYTGQTIFTLPQSESYDFSYTGFSLRPNDMQRVAEMEGEQWSEARIIDELGGGKVSTGKKFYNEINKRLLRLTTAQKYLLMNGDLPTRRQIAFLAMCKSHLFIRDLMVELLREKYLVFDQHLTPGELNVFFNRKMDQHHEMHNMKESSIKKIKQVTLRILEQAEIIDSVESGFIQPQLLDTPVIHAIVTDNPDWLKIFMLSDADIKQYVA